MTDLSQLQETWRGFFSDCVEKLVRDSDIVPTFMVVSGKPDIPDAVVFVDGPAMNSPTAKGEISRNIHRLVKELDAQAVLSVLDTYLGYTDNPKHTELIQRFRLNVVQAAELGLCSKRECLIAMMESPIINAMEQQFYRRDQNGKVTLEERIAPEYDGMSGRFGSFFKHQEAESA